jgi:hypothetical protein
MAITSIKTGSSFKNLIKYNDFLAGNTAYQPTAYESIATVTVGSGGASSVSFSSIPSGYQHLQVRSLIQTNRTSYAVDQITWRFNDDSGNNYAAHYIRGGFATTPNAAASVSATSTNRITYPAISTSVVANTFTASVMDILDYANTNKYKTTRELAGYDLNGTAGTDSYGGTITLGSGLWMSTSAITKITIDKTDGSLWSQHSKFGLFGIKGA